ncbi:sporulation killing factor biosynthesis/export protein SkfH [Bacillus subtilis]|uniref:sporulation killing factor biosynthesis/export protein SkfH n=1 Tax=Bacillus subtilis TaxID=1423 RepID=UPI002E20E4C9|nr:sporulation killing factor biosynthesis/export protein SkfH [Bacillus subtilis]
MKDEQMLTEWPSHLPWLNQSQNDFTFPSDTYLLLYFWSMSCPNCHQLTDKVLQDIKDMNVKVIGVHVPYIEEEKSMEVVLTYALDRGLAIPIVLDQNYEIVTTCHVQGIPSFCLLSQYGQIITKTMGDVGWGKMLKKIAGL